MDVFLDEDDVGVDPNNLLHNLLQVLPVILDKFLELDEGRKGVQVDGVFDNHYLGLRQVEMLMFADGVFI